jgi:alanine-synthesizing transaminase
VRFSARATFDDTPNALTVALNVRAARGEGFIDLTQANPTRAELPYPWAEIAAALGEGACRPYMPSPLGLYETREFLASTLGSNARAEHIFLTASTSETFSFLLKLFCDPGDEILVPAPSYPLFDFLTAFENVRGVPYALQYTDEWRIDIGAMKAAITKRTRAIFVISPNNPTGNVLTENELSALLDLGLPVISDEVFGSYAPDWKEHQTQRGLFFALSGLSKACALPHLKLAWTHVKGDLALVEKALGRLEILGDTFLSPNAPTMYALPKLWALTALTRTAIRDRIARNRAFLSDALTGTALTLLASEGGWYAVVRIPNVEADHVAALRLLEVEGVLVHPGTYFGFSRMQTFVISLLTPEHDFGRGVACLQRRSFE